MQRLAARNPSERPLLSPETGNAENRRQDTRRNGLFLIDDSFRGLGRLDGGVRSHMRTSLPRTWIGAGQRNREYSEKFSQKQGSGGLMAADQ
jgi:hypothetical protein